MNIAKCSLMAAAALVFLPSPALAQQKPGQVEAGIEAHGLPLGQVRPMTVAIAKQLVAAARKASCSPGGPCTGAFAIVDDAGVLVYFETIDGVLADAPDLAIKKAKASALWRRPTKVFQQAVDSKRNSSYADGTFQDMTTSPGGVPLLKDGRVVGGFGIADTGSAKAGDKIDDAVVQEAAGSAALARQKTDRVAAGTEAHGLPLGQVRPMTVELAKQLVAAAKKASCSPPAGSCSGAFAVVDDAGVLVYVEVIDGVLAGGPDLAIRKAKASALWRRPTQVFQDAVNSKRNSSYADGTFQGMTTSPGGVPVFRNGRVIGGVGIAAVGFATKQIDAGIVAQATKLFGKQ